MSYTFYTTPFNKPIQQNQKSKYSLKSQLLTPMNTQNPNILPTQHLNQAQRPTNQSDHDPNQPPTFQWPIWYGNHMQRKLNEQAKKKIWIQVNKHDKQLFDDFRPYGSAFFSNDIKKKQIIQLFTYDVLRMIEWESWYLQIKSLKQCALWVKILSLIKQCQVSHFQIKFAQKAQSPTFWKSIQPIDFFYLKSLTLYKCRVENIEPLSFLNAPKLETINLIYNEVFQYKCLQKTAFPLKNLFMMATSQDNRFFQPYRQPCARLDSFSRWNFQLKILRLQKHEYNTVIMNDLSFLAKSKQMKQTQIFTIAVSRRQRITQRKLIQKFNRQTALKFEVFQLEIPMVQHIGQIQQINNIDLYQIRN